MLMVKLTFNELLLLIALNAETEVGFTFYNTPESRSLRHLNKSIMFLLSRGYAYKQYMQIPGEGGGYRMAITPIGKKALRHAFNSMTDQEKRHFLSLLDSIGIEI